MSDERPQYGEYATPDEQRARAGLPPVDAAPPAPMPPAPALAPSAAAAPPRPFDRAITFALLAVGLLNVLSSLGGFFNLAATLNQTLELMGLDGEFTNIAAARLWGPIAAFVLVAGFAITVWRALRRLRAGQSAWWVPLVGFVVTTVIVSVCISVPMFGDPAFLQGLSVPAG